MDIDFKDQVINHLCLGKEEEAAHNKEVLDQFMAWSQQLTYIKKEIRLGKEPKLQQNTVQWFNFIQQEVKIHDFKFMELNIQSLFALKTKFELKKINFDENDDKFTKYHKCKTIQRRLDELKSFVQYFYEQQWRRPSRLNVSPKLDRLQSLQQTVYELLFERNKGKSVKIMSFVIIDHFAF